MSNVSIKLASDVKRAILHHGKTKKVEVLAKAYDLKPEQVELVLKSHDITPLH